MSKNAQTIEAITDKMIEKMEQGNLVWNKPWTCNVLPQNYTTRKPYQGWNLFSTLYSGFNSPFWLTANQIKKLGGTWSGKGTLITFWNISNYKKKNDRGEEEEKKSFNLKYYYVWNEEQIQGIDFKHVEQTDKVNTCEELEALIYNLPSKVNVKHTESNQAYYSPMFDYINMPMKKQFVGTAEYYSTLIHETIHATGHTSRLNRLSVNDGKFDSKKHSYSFEELVAEIGASFLNAMYGIATEQSEANSSAYLQGWLKTFKQDKTMLFKASVEAQKAVNYIVNAEKDDEGTSEGVNENAEPLNCALI